jgi:hypothetical protein
LGAGPSQPSASACGADDEGAATIDTLEVEILQRLPDGTCAAHLYVRAPAALTNGHVYYRG